MVRQNLQGNEQCCNNASCQIFTPVSQYETCYCRWYISQRDKLQAKEQIRTVYGIGYVWEV